MRTWRQIAVCENVCQQHAIGQQTRQIVRRLQIATALGLKNQTISVGHGGRKRVRQRDGTVSTKGGACFRKRCFVTCMIRGNCS